MPAWDENPMQNICAQVSATEVLKVVSAIQN